MAAAPGTAYTDIGGAVMAANPAARNPALRTHHGERIRGPRRGTNVLPWAGLFGGAIAVSICVAEVVFFCAYLVALPVMVLMAIAEIPGYLRRMTARDGGKRGLSPSPPRRDGNRAR